MRGVTATVRGVMFLVMALLSFKDTRSLRARGEQRRSVYFNIVRDIPRKDPGWRNAQRLTAQAAQRIAGGPLCVTQHSTHAPEAYAWEDRGCSWSYANLLSGAALSADLGLLARRVVLRGHHLLISPRASHSVGVFIDSP